MVLRDLLRYMHISATILAIMTYMYSDRPPSPCPVILSLYVDYIYFSCLTNLLHIFPSIFWQIYIYIKYTLYSVCT